MFLVYAEFLIISHFPKQFLSECPLHKSTEKTAKETRKVCTYSNTYTMPRITRCRPNSHSMQQGSRTTSNLLLILSQTSSKHPTEQCVLFIPVLKDHSAVRQNVCFPEKSSCKGSCLFLQNTKKHLHHNLCSVSVSFV